MATTTKAKFTIKVRLGLEAEYTIRLSDKAAKAICADYLDPDEPWADQAEHTLEVALEQPLNDQLCADGFCSLPPEVLLELDGQTAALMLLGDEASVEDIEMEVMA